MEILQTYLVDKDLQVASSILMEYLTYYDVEEFINGIFKAAFEKKGDESKDAVGKLSCHFIANNYVTKEEYLKGLSELVESLGDYSVDMPAAWEYLAKALFHMCSMDILSLPELAPSFKNINGSLGSAKFLKCFLNLLMEKKGKSWLEQKWIIWNISRWGGNISLISDFVRGDKLESFITQNNFQFLCNAKVLTTETARNEIHRMICANEPLHVIRYWVNQNIGQERSWIQLLQSTEEFKSDEFDISEMKNILIKPYQNDLKWKETRNVEVKTPVSDASPIPTPPAPETKIPPTVVVNCEQPATEEELKTKNEIITDEDKEKEKEDLMIATKNEENNKQTASMKTDDSSHAQVIENVNKAGVPVLKHNYKDGQWSPINLEGKKKYDKEFIMSLMHDPQSKKRPQNLAEFLELLKDDHNQQRPTDKYLFNNMSRGHQDILIPDFASGNSSQRAGQPGITERLSAQDGTQKETNPAVIHMSLSLQQDVKLHEAENAWKPSRLLDGNNMTDEETKTDVLYKRVRGVLNKLTPQKFNKLVEQVKALPIDNLPRLQGVIDLVFKKAVDEPSFSVAYAQMCKILQKMGVPSGDYSEDGSPILVNFRKLLIDKCQHEFEKNTAAELKRDERLKEINVEQDPEKKKMLQLTFEEEERRIRMKSLGNIRFIGELYKLNMLTARIMHSCFNNLLNGGDEESLECLCKLLTTVGQGLETSTNDDKKNADAQVDDLRYQKQNSKRGDRDADKERDVEDMRRMAARKQQDAQNQFNEFNGYFKRLEQIVKSKGTGANNVSCRVRFMIQDLIDLRNNKWIPRRDDSNPKTIDQIQKEADREIMDMNIALNSPQERKRQENRNMMDNRKRMAMVSGPGGVVPAPPVQPAPKPVREKRAIKIVDPVTGVDIVEETNRNSTPPRSGESSARQTPQPYGGMPGAGRGSNQQPSFYPQGPRGPEMKQQQSHMPPQAHQIPTQQGGQLLGPYGMPGAGRGSNQQPSFYPQGPRGPAGQTRMTHSRSVVMPNNSQYMQPFQVYSAPLVPNLSSQQPLLFTSPHMNHQSFQQRIQGNGPQMYPPQTILLPQHSIYPPYPQQQVYFTSSSIQQIPRTGGSGPVPSSQGAVPPQPPPGSMAMVSGPGGVVPAPPVQPAPKPAREKRAIKTVDPVTGVDIVEEMNRNSTPPRSGESSARQTPQPNFGQNTDRTVAAEFATKVAMAARSGSESTNSSSLQQASSRTSNYSENESQASPDPHDASPSKLDTSVESISSESQIIENNIPYDANQQAAILRGWTMGPGMEPLGPMLIHHPGMMIPDDLMRAGPPNPPPREYAHAAVPNPWMPEGSPMPVPVIINEKPPAPMEAPIRQVSEGVIPTVSALAHAPTVDIPPRLTRDQFP